VSQSTRRESEHTPQELFSLAQILHLMRIEFARSQRYGYPLACLLVAVDGLGQVRDVHGYDTKQAVLDEVTAQLQIQTRTCDFLGRLMDDRLLAVVPHTGPEGARALGERLLAAVRALVFESDGRRVPMTLSIGAAYSSGADTMFFDALLSAGESALEEAASGGGDRVVLRDPLAAGH
jgi:diguanylate cyclase (GGDEF)-like protein